jgi:hypothetical protein
VPLPTGTANVQVGASFDGSVATTLNGPGSGTVTVQAIGAPTNVCTHTGAANGTSCVLRAPLTTATLVAAPAANSVFQGWDAPGCDSTPTCVVAVGQVGSVTASFGLPPAFGLAIVSDPAGNGRGRVNGPVTQCRILEGGATGGSCNDTRPALSAVNYNAFVDSNTVFVGWGGLCAGQAGTSCSLTPLTQGGNVVARFDLAALQPMTVQGVNSVDPGSGTVTSAPAGISCAFTGSSGTGTCRGAFPVGGNVTLTATPQAGSVFAGWSGDCAGAAPVCVVAMGGPRIPRAFFLPSAPTTLALAFAPTSDADGALSSSNGLSCTGNFEVFAGNGCAPAGGSVPMGQPVTVTPSASSGAAFVGWTTGPCTGQFVNPCTFTPAAPTTVTARFGTQVSVSVEVEQQGNANQATYDARLRVETIRDTVGIVVPFFPIVISGPYTVYVGDQMRFTASPSIGSFSGWTGACASFGSSPVCTITVTANTAQVRAVYVGAGAALRADPSRPPAAPTVRRVPRLNRAR